MGGNRHGVTAKSATEALRAIQDAIHPEASITIRKSSLYVRESGAIVAEFSDPEKLVKFLRCCPEDPGLEAVAKEIYECYPRRRDPRASMQAIIRALKDDSIPVAPADRPMYLAIATTLFAIFCEKEGKEKTFIPYPATWFNRQSYLNGLATTLRLLKSQPFSQSSQSLKQRAAALCLSAKPQNVWSQPKAPLEPSVPSTSGPSPLPSSTD